VFEQAHDYDEARQMLETMPVARPVIYTLAGCRPGERCVIERTENDFNTRFDDHGAANDWLERAPLWEGRIGARRMLTCSFEEAGRLSQARRAGLASWQGSFASERFSWVTPPVLNPYTRIAVEMCPAHDILRAIGYERQAGVELAEPATELRELSAEMAA
jgi:hypothetical protein